jgi:hypothetical protein
MSAALKFNRTLQQREENRESRFAATYSCKLITSEPTARVILIRPVDVSHRGLGFMVREPLLQGTILWLEIGTNRFRVELAYCNNHLGIENLYRGGLFLREADGDLAALCYRLGLVDEKANGTI